LNIKKTTKTILKTALFIFLWVILATLVPIPENISSFAWRLSAEAIALIAVILLTVIFSAIEKNKIKLDVEKVGKYICIGLILGMLWIGISVGVMVLLGTSFSGNSRGVKVLLWLIPVLFNAAAQELLVRGYVYSLIKREYSLVTATVITTLLFVLFHGGTFSEGLLPIVNIVLTSLLLTSCLEVFEGLTVPILMHFVWNGVGGIVFGGINLAEDYPSLLTMNSNGSNILTGGICKIEGSIVVLFVNIIMMAIILVWKRNIAKNGENI